MADQKKRVTAPLTPEEIDEALHEIPPEEFIDQFDAILAQDTMPEALEKLLTLDDYMEQELREMFESIIAQYVQPVEFAINRVAEGDHSRRTASEALDALAPILSASETLEYEDITTILKDIERPLKDLHGGGKRRLAKKEVSGVVKAWDDLRSIIKPGAEREIEDPAAGPSLGALPRHLPSVSASDVRRLRAAGLATLRDLVSAPVAEIVHVTGLAEATAERIRAFAVGALASSGAPKPVVHSSSGVPAGWMRVTIESDICKGRLTFEYETVGRYLEPILAVLAEGDARGGASGRGERGGRASQSKRKGKGGAD